MELESPGCVLSTARGAWRGAQPCTQPPSPLQGTAQHGCWFHFSFANISMQLLSLQPSCTAHPIAVGLRPPGSCSCSFLRARALCCQGAVAELSSIRGYQQCKHRAWLWGGCTSSVCWGSPPPIALQILQHSAQGGQQSNT